ncbi:hypothetical protein DICVIV_07902 [Dictyocaulus viviparus]|uniref:Serine carboxypeptidase S28 n=1 Tax=Dictyocaulus viviparus TaxID=29172 RepID=A0A0D8XQM3_DICVI|nr:hypothetical protein DICVIV_07902 [Dictyocaulus viviparus]
MHSSVTSSRKFLRKKNKRERCNNFNETHVDRNLKILFAEGNDINKKHNRNFRIVTRIWISNAWSPHFHLGRPMFGMKIQHNHGQLLDHHEATILKDSGFGVGEGYFAQKLDHFDENSTATWSQRYFFNFKYQIPSSNAVFLMLGGEGPENIYWFLPTIKDKKYVEKREDFYWIDALCRVIVSNENYPFIRWAKRFGAIVFDLEHRFYGNSRPTPDQSVENLRYLSSRQAIEDIAEFIRVMNSKYNLSRASWITFGGSYSAVYQSCNISKNVVLQLFLAASPPDVVNGISVARGVLKAKTG